MDLLKKKKMPENNNTQNQKTISDLEKAGLIFFKHKNYYSALFIFEKLILKEPANTNAWYGLGNCLAMASNFLKKEELLKLAIACFKTSIKINNGAHKMSEEFLEMIKKATKLSSAEFDLVKPAEKEQVKDLDKKYDLDINILVKEFAGLNEKDRMVQVIFLGETADETFYPLMKYAILEDTDIDVRFAALKRIHLFRDQPDLESVFEKAVKVQKEDELEPYLSMALNRITAAWAEKFRRK